MVDLDRCNECIRESLELAKRMIILADEGEASCQDDGCAVLCGVIRDCAYKIRLMAERERRVHVDRGVWTPRSQETADSTQSK